MLPYALGRSYGDSCLNDGGLLLLTRDLNRFMEFDKKSGLLRCEAGVTLAEILDLTVPHGWFLPVTPGTKYVSIGGAIANDVHGKNHHQAGTFGRFVTRFELLRSDGTRLLCSPSENSDWYRATIGGLGLTGLMLWAEIQLKSVSGPTMAVQTVRFGSLTEFFALSEESADDFEYTVAWIDCLGKESHVGRGIFIRGNHSHEPHPNLTKPGPGLSLPFYAPQILLNQYSIRAFNELYYRKQWQRLSRRTSHYDPFFYPLDGLLNWNRLYGRQGFYQYQCVVPYENSPSPIQDMLRIIGDSQLGSFLAVLKVFGSIPSPGMLSFPRAGVTLALDFVNRGPRTLALMDRLDEIVCDSGGAVYPAKDARLSSQHFKRFFPQYQEFAEYVDPKFSSSCWRRVMGAEGQTP